MNLVDRLRSADVADLPDWRVAEILNAPEPSLPVVVSVVPTIATPSTVMGALGPEAGAAALDRLSEVARTAPVVRWALEELRGSRGLDVGHAAVRQQIDSLVPAVLSRAQADTLKALAERRRHPSWAEYHGVEVTARSVGLARGAKE